MGRPRPKRVPKYFGLRIYMISALLYLLLVFPVAGILLIKNLPAYLQDINAIQGTDTTNVSGPVPPEELSLADSVRMDLRQDTTGVSDVMIGFDETQVTKNNGTSETVSTDDNQIGGTLGLLLRLLLVSFILGFIFNLPFKIYFRRKARNKPVKEKLFRFCKKYLLKTPVIMTGILSLPFLITILYMMYMLLFTEGLDEINRKFYIQFFFISFTASVLILLFVYFWQKHRVHIRYLEHLFTEEELRRRIFKLREGKIRNRLWISSAMTTLLPLLIVAFYLIQSLTAIKDLEIDEITQEHLKILLGRYSTVTTDITVDSISSLFYVDAIDSILMFVGIGTGIFIALLYLVFFVKWTTEDIVYPVSELLKNIKKTGQGELENYAIVRTNDEIGVLTEGFNDMSVRLKSYIQDIYNINKANSRFVPKQFLEFLGKDSIVDINLGDQVQKEMTVLFTDIRDFTTISETMTPKENFDFINNYLGYMEPVIRNNNGFIDKYIGDSIMALFPVNSEHALNSAIEMRIKLTEFNQIMSQFNKPKINSGIGIHSGSLMLGVVGGEGRMDGTVISDAVNLSSRIEGLTKIYGSCVILTEDTLIRLRDPGMYNFRFLDIVRVKGKKEAVYIFELVDGEPDEIRELKLSTLKDYGEAIQLYKKRSFKKAMEGFSEVLARNEQDQVSRIYKERCRKYIDEGVPDDWDGAEPIDHKF